jgi:hypothetical protein
MIKSTSTNSTITPEGKIETAETILGRIQEPQTRWSAGALVTAIMAQVVTAVVCLVSASKVVAVNFATAADLTDALTDECAAAGNAYTFVPESGSSSRSRVLSMNGISVTISSNSASAVVDAVLLPSHPTYTALTLVNKLETVLEEEELPYLLVIDQLSGEAHCYTFASQAAADAALAGVVAAGASVEVAYDLVLPADEVTPTAPFAWE